MCFLRVDVGGERVLKYAKDLLRVKFPQLSDDLSSPTVNDIIHKYCRVAMSYGDELKRFEESVYFHNQSKRIQLQVDMNVCLCVSSVCALCHSSVLVNTPVFCSSACSVC
eukprot:m.120800 g.120800  ORF g.120800 m.120800 type:complete len:110 (+) comp12916_c0_seq104:1114-1443(+)